MQKAALEKEELTRTFVEGTARIGGALQNEKVLREEVSEAGSSIPDRKATFVEVPD